MKKLPMALVCGIAVIALTIVLYFTILSNALLEAIHFISLVAIVLAEIITTCYACFVRDNPRKLAAVVVSGFMVPISVILSVVYIVNFPEGYGTYMGLYSVGLLVTNIFAYILLRFDADKSEENDRLQNAKGHMLMLRKMVMCVMAESGAEPYQARLRALEENLHFSNDGVIVPEDEHIRQMLLQLQENIGNPGFGTEELLDKIEKAVRMRAIIASRNV